MKFRAAGLTPESIVDGPGFRFTVWTQGCPHHCEGCHNPQTWDPSQGFEADTDAVLAEILKDPLLDGVTLSGGDPFFQAKPMADLARKVHAKGLNVIAYTGYVFEFLLSHANEENGFMELIRECDYIVDGPFILAERSLELKFRGSRNQRFIDVERSLSSGTTVALDDDAISLM